jgi:hypothetical protein
LSVDRRTALVRGLGVLVLLSVLALLAVSMGLLPAREPEAAPTRTLDVARAVDMGAVDDTRSAKATAALELRLSRFALGRAGGEGARAFAVELGSGQQGVLVFAPGAGYELLSFELASVPPRARRVARFASKAALPGGAAGGDFDGDGVFDLVLGVAPGRGVLHEPGSGAYLVRGRRGGGYEASRPLAETATQAIAAADLDGAPPTDVLVLTRGDVAAQRPGELWAFAKGPLLTRTRVVKTGLEPRDLLLREAGGTLTALVVAGQPGAVFAVTLPRDGAVPAVASVPLAGAQGFVHGAAGAPQVRTPSSVHALSLEGALAAEVWAAEANVGPAVKRDDLVLGALLHGVAAVGGGAAAAHDELAFGDEVTTRDLVAYAEASGRTRVLALVESGGELALIAIPAPPWESRSAPVLESAPLEDAHGFADVPLE